MKNKFYHEKDKKLKISEFITPIHKISKSVNKHKPMNISLEGHSHNSKKILFNKKLIQLFHKVLNFLKHLNF